MICTTLCSVKMLVRKNDLLLSKKNCENLWILELKVLFLSSNFAEIIFIMCSGFCRRCERRCLTLARWCQWVQLPTEPTTGFQRSDWTPTHRILAATTTTTWVKHFVRKRTLYIIMNVILHQQHHSVHQAHTVNSLTVRHLHVSSCILLSSFYSENLEIECRRFGQTISWFFILPIHNFTYFTWEFCFVKLNRISSKKKQKISIEVHLNSKFWKRNVDTTVEWAIFAIIVWTDWISAHLFIENMIISV